jgi:hypothetical protein
MIKKLYVFDFDGSLMKTPKPHDGKIIWTNYYKRKYPHRGWWSCIESMDMKAFKITPIQSVVREYVAHRSEKDALCILLTSRLPIFEERVKELLDKFGIRMDEYLFKRGLLDKPARVNELLKKYPTVEYVEIWDDRDVEIFKFKDWERTIKDVEVKINKVD